MYNGEEMHEREARSEQSREGEVCDVCQERYPTVYLLSDEVWDEISGGSNLLCLRCADGRARKLGIELFWEATVGEFPLEAQRRLHRIVAEHHQLLDRLADG